MSSGDANRNQTERGQDLNNFMQGVLESNHELGFLPLRVDNTGERVIHKAYMKKAKLQTLFFDFDDGSFTLEQSKDNRDIYAFNMIINCLVDTTVDVYFGASETRQKGEENLIKDIRGGAGSFEFRFQRGNGQKLPLGQCVIHKKKIKANMKDNYFPIMVRLRETDNGMKKVELREQEVYAYLSIKGTGTAIKPLLEKKGVKFHGRFLWTKNVYDFSKEGNASFDSGNLCSICYENKINTLIIPCRHMVLCHFCAKELKNRFQKCPMCRLGVSGFIKLSQEERATYYRKLREKTRDEEGDEYTDKQLLDDDMEDENDFEKEFERDLGPVEPEKSI